VRCRLRDVSRGLNLTTALGCSATDCSLSRSDRVRTSRGGRTRNGQGAPRAVGYGPAEDSRTFMVRPNDPSKCNSVMTVSRPDEREVENRFGTKGAFVSLG